MLEGLKVLAFTHYQQGPSCAQMFGDLGADVVKVEAPQGAFERAWSGPDSFINGTSVFFMQANRNMKSLSLNLKSEEGKQIIYDLVKEYDVLIENFRPGVLEKLGFGYDVLKEINPGLVYCSMSGFGSSGPYKDRPGQDLLAQSMGGLVRMTGRGKPTPAGSSIADSHSAALATVGILAALRDRDRTGVGHKVDVSLIESVLNLQAEPYAYYLNTPEKIWPNQISTGLANTFQSGPYGCYDTKDDYICISLCKHKDIIKVLEPGALDGFTEADVFDRREEYDAICAEQFKKKTTDEWIKLFTEVGIWHVRPYTYEDIENDPQVQWNKSIITLRSPSGDDIRVLNHPVKYDGQPTTVRLNPPAKGGNAKEVLGEVGYSAERVEELKEMGVLFWDEPDASGN